MDIVKEIGKKAKIADVQVMSYLQGEDTKLMKAVRHYPSAGGKRLRPVLAEVIAEAIGKAGKKAIPFACSLEIIHNFTLVHDDVMDNDATRRGRPAVHVLYNVPTAIIAGDAMFARAFEVLSETDVPSQKHQAAVQVDREHGLARSPKVSRRIWTSRTSPRPI